LDIILSKIGIHNNHEKKNVAPEKPFFHMTVLTKKYFDFRNWYWS